MIKIKKLAIASTLALTLTVGLAGCSSPEEVTDPATTPIVETTAAETTQEETTQVPEVKSEKGEKPEGGQPGQGGMEGQRPPMEDEELTTVTISDTYDFEVNYSVFESFDELPEDISVEREEVVSFERPEGDTHYYEVVYVPTGNVSWVQAAVLAESEGGYLASLTTEEENTFVFNLVDDEKYFWEFPDDYTPDSHYRIMIGPFLGGTKTGDSEDSLDGWEWISGEAWSYSNWAVNLDDGVTDQDPRDNTQPNGKGAQTVMGFGELNEPVDTWGDYYSGVAQYENMRMPMGYNYGFVIEYDSNPNE